MFLAHLCFALAIAVMVIGGLSALKWTCDSNK